FAALLFYMLTAIGLFLLRAKRPNAERPVRAAGYPWLPALYVLGTGVLCVNLLFQQTRYAGLGLIIVALGVPVYFAWRRFAGGTHRRLVGPRFHVEIEEILPRRRAVGPALELREVEPRLGERGERTCQRAWTVRQLQAKRGFRRDVGRRRRGIARHQQKAGLVVRLVLDPLRHYVETVAARR